MIGLFGIVSEPSHSLEDLIQLWRRPGFIIYFSMIEFALVSLLVASAVVEHALKRDAKANLMAGNFHHHRHHRHRRYRSASVAGSVRTNSGYGNHHHHNIQPSSSWSSYCGRMITGRLQQRNMTPAKIRTMLGICYGTVSGLLSSQTLLIAKSGIELLMLTILGDNQFKNPLSWFLGVALVSVALLQVCSLLSVMSWNTFFFAGRNAPRCKHRPVVVMFSWMAHTMGKPSLFLMAL